MHLLLITRCGVQFPLRLQQSEAISSVHSKNKQQRMNNSVLVVQSSGPYYRSPAMVILVCGLAKRWEKALKPYCLKKIECQLYNQRFATEIHLNLSTSYHVPLPQLGMAARKLETTTATYHNVTKFKPCVSTCFRVYQKTTQSYVYGRSIITKHNGQYSTHKQNTKFL